MGFVPYEKPVISGYSGLPEPQDALDPSVMQTLGAAFRQDNTVVSLWNDRTRGVDFLSRDGLTGDEILKDIEGTKYAEQWDRFAGVFNRKALTALKSQIDAETEDRRTLAAAGPLGWAASFGAAALDPINFIPVGGQFARGGSWLRMAGRTALAGALGAGISEMALHASQQTRTLEESGYAIGGGALLGGLLGAGVGKLLSRSEARALADVADTALSKAPDESDGIVAALADGMREGASVGAARVEKTAETLADNTPLGGSAKAVAKTVGKTHVFDNPLLRASRSESAAHRSIMADLAETGYYLEKNAEGRGNIAVETAVKYWERGALGEAVGSQKALWKEARKAGVDMTYQEFRDAAGRAMRRGDVGENPYVGKLATAWRKALFDPLKDAAIEARLLPEDVQVKTATSYFSRMWSHARLTAGEQRFRKIAYDWLDEQVRQIELKRAELDTREQAAKAKGGKIAADTVAKNLPGFVSEADRADYLSRVVDEIYNTLTGRAKFGDIPFDVVVNERGPLKDRTFNIPDNLIEDFLESDVELVGRRYARIMSADVEIARKFGSPDMKEQVKAVVEDYRKLREATTDPKELKRLAEAEKKDVADIEAVRDLIRGTYRRELNATNFARVSKVAMQFNYMRTMGGMLWGNLADAVRPLWVHGLGNVFHDVITPAFIGNIKALKLSAGSAKRLGAVTERLLQSRIATMAELGDPYALRTPLERWMDNASTAFTSATGLPWFNDFNKSVASILTQSRIIRNVRNFDKLSAKERTYMGFLGIGDADRAGAIREAFDAFGETVDGVLVPNVEKWPDDVRRMFAAALNKDVDSTVVTKGLADVPLWAHTPGGKMFSQFKTFSLASNQRVLMRGLQEGPASFLTGVAMSTAVGMMIYALKQIESGRELSDNPGVWIAEGLDRSGVFALAFEVNNAWERSLDGFGLYDLAGLAGGGDSKERASRYATRSRLEAILGPMAGFADSALSLAAMPNKALGRNIEALTGGQVTPGLDPSDITQMRRMLPWASLWQVRWLIDGATPLRDLTGFKGVVPELKDAVQ